MRTQTRTILIISIAFMVGGCNSINNDESLSRSEGPPPLPKMAEGVKPPPYDNPPQPITPIRPVYPETAKDNNIEGTVIVQAHVLASGEVGDLVVLKGVDKALDEAAIAAVKNVKFKPAEKDGVPQEVWISIPINFKMK